MSYPFQERSASLNNNALNPDSPQQPAKTTFGIAAGLFLVTLLVSPVLDRWSGHFATQEWHLSDEGIVLYASYRTAMDQLPHISFTYYYAGGVEVVLGTIFKMLGSTFGVARWAFAADMAANVSLVFLLLVRFSMGYPLAATFAVGSVVIGRVLNYHVYPAWFAITLVPLAMLFLVQRVNYENRMTIIWAGVTLGLTTSMKQSTGMFAFAGFLYYLYWHHSITTHKSPHATQRQSPALAALQLFVMLLVPILLSLIFLYIIRRSITPLNLFMFMTLPLTLTAACVWSLWRKAVESPETLRSRLHGLERDVMLLGIGYCGGIAPILLYYLAHNGLQPFIAESFLRIQSTLSSKEVFWPFGSTESGGTIAMIRRLGIYLIPMTSVVAGLVWGMKKQKSLNGSVKSHALVLNSATLATLWFTLYPLVGITYLYYLLPMIVVPFAFAINILLEKRIKSMGGRVGFVAGVFLLSALLYLGSRLAAGDWQHQGVYADEIVPLDVNAKDAYYPKSTARVLDPVLAYLKTRPHGETFVMIDRTNEAVAFLTKRTTAIDYALLFYSGHGYEPRNFEQIMWLVQEKQTNTVIIAKKYLSESTEVRKLLEYLSRRYSLALDTPNYDIYQLNAQ